MQSPAAPYEAYAFHFVPLMDVLALTIWVSSCLAGVFILWFAMEFRRARKSSPERDSLLPLDIDDDHRP